MSMTAAPFVRVAWVSGRSVRSAVVSAADAALDEMAAVDGVIGVAGDVGVGEPAVVGVTDGARSVWTVGVAAAAGLADQVDVVAKWTLLSNRRSTLFVLSQGTTYDWTGSPKP